LPCQLNAGISVMFISITVCSLNPLYG
jgi:hypothetical protein